LFDERFLDAIVRDWREGRFRLGAMAGVALVLAFGAGWAPGLGWAACAILLEVGLQALTRPVAESGRISDLAAAGVATLKMAQTYVWIAAGIALWIRGGAGGQACAMMYFAALTLYLVIRPEASPVLQAASLPILGAPLLTPLLFPAPHMPLAAALPLGALMAALGGANLLRGRAGPPAPRIAARRAPAPDRSGEADDDADLSLEGLREAKAQAEAASHAKSAFLAVMSHEIRTPLNGVLGMTQALVADPSLSHAQRARLQTIRQSSEALLAILNDILDLSKIEAGKLELETTEFDLWETARDVADSFKMLASQKGLDFKLVVAPPARGVCLGDPTRVRQVLMNVVSNALKFTEEGEISVQVERAGREVRFTVADTGVGIDAAHLERIFRKFEQADASSTRRYGGTGLGLAICRDLCELMDGTITAQSEPGKGARFVITLPLPPATRAAAPDTPAAPPKVDFSRLRVLAAEDNPVNKLVLKTLLAQVGIEPVIVENGALAVEAWHVSQFDLILMDIQMPEMDGIEATRVIRGEEAQTGRDRTVIIALTANAMAHHVAEYAEVGMDAHIPKPLDIRALSAMIEKLLAPREVAASPQRAGWMKRVARA
jgi:signal transduction histidine kinase